MTFMGFKILGGKILAREFLGCVLYKEEGLCFFGFMNFWVYFWVQF